MISVATYCRVSTDQEDQANSFEAQKRYFKEYIDRQPSWTLYGVYADEGISGTSTRKRVQFNRMIQDARRGKFQLILTKEVSRFSRNILDTIAYTRELKGLGVGVLFMNDGINTLDPDAELRLSIMGSIAQEESRKTSSRVKWGQTRQMERGVVFGRSLLGYDVKDGKMTVNPEGAALVRLIFQKYGVEKKGTSVIARELREAGYRTYTGNPNWSPSHIIKLLKNEKYVGDLVQKKTITPDYLTHAKKYNHGEEDLVILRDHHTPVIDRELWNTVQEELHKRSRHSTSGTGHSSLYFLSGKIQCGECGASFVARTRTGPEGKGKRRWACRTAVRQGTRHLDPHGNSLGCDVGWTLREELAREMVQQALDTVSVDRLQLVERVTALSAAAIQEDRQTPEKGSLERSIANTQKKLEALLDAYCAGDIQKEEMQIMKARYDRETAVLQKRLKDAERVCRDEPPEARVRMQAQAILSGQLQSETFYRQLLDHMVVCKDRRVELTLRQLPQKWIFMMAR